MNSVFVKVCLFAPKSPGVPRGINYFQHTGVYSSVMSKHLGISTALSLSGKFAS